MTKKIITMVSTFLFCQLGILAGYLDGYLATYLSLWMGEFCSLIAVFLVLSYIESGDYG